MKGYFSRIAKHSGLRFSGQEARSRSSAGDVSKTGHTFPLEKLETVLIPASQSPETSGEIREKGHSENPGPPRGDASAPSHKEPPRKSLVPETPQELKGIPDQQPVVETRTAPPSESVDAGPPPVGDDERKRTATSSPDSSVVEIASSVEGDRQTVEDQPPRAEPPLREPRVIVEVQDIVAADSKEQRKNFFTKTAEAMDIGDLGKDEVQRILLQETQEWVAASESETDPVQIETPRELEAIVVKESATPTRELVVADPDRREAENVEKERLEEQVLDLSIGTISVVIEDAEKSEREKPPPRPVDNQTAKKETKREYSRLNRNYL